MDTFLSRILEHKITVEDIKKWITNPKDATDEIRSHDCEPTDFAFFLLSYLRDETTSILISKENKQEEIKDDTTLTRKPSEKKNTKKIIPMSRPTNSHPKRAAPITLANFIVTKPTQKQKRNKSQHDNESTRVDSPPAALKRRINPLKVSVLNSMPSTSNPFNVAEENQVDLNHERQLLREQLSLDVPNISKLSILSHDQKTISNKKQLDTLSKVYSLILDSELALNIMAELYFLIELLTLDDVTISQESDTKIFNSIQNCAYFASKTLHRQQKLIQCLDPTTIRLLSENLYLKEFSPELVSHLLSLKPKTRRTLSVDSNVISYQADTYDRQNFSSQDAFQLFRRQRDAFYSILETWDNERYFTSSLIVKVQAIFKQKLEPEFYMHFSNLFMSQLIASCIGVNSEKSTNFPDLQVDPMRLKRLQDRLVNPARTSGGPCPSPEFTGWEEFYRDFIKIAANHQLNVHLHNVFITKISELNAQQFAPSDLQDSDTCVEEETVSKFVSCALSLQLVAKFLGWLTFDPYMPSNIRALPEHVIALQAADRHEVHPDLDGCGILSAAENQGRLVLAIPWLCSYVVQLDPASLRLPHYTRLLRHLLALQRALSGMHKTSLTARALMRFCLGWALGILAENNPGVWDMARLGLVRVVILIYSQTILIFFSHEVPECKPGSLDYLELVDSQALLSLCPFLAELRTRLSAGGVTTARPCPGPRHITPVTTLDPPQKLELQLEASFLQTQPSHVRRTLDFVSERVSYSCTKHLLSGILAQQAHSLREEVQRVVKTEVLKHHQLRKDFAKFVAAVKEGLAKWTEDKAASHYKEVHSACQTEVQQFCSSHCSAALAHLLVPSPTPLPSQALASIATRNAASKVHSWLQSYMATFKVLLSTYVYVLGNCISPLCSTQVRSRNKRVTRWKDVPDQRTSPLHLKVTLATPTHCLLVEDQ
ncbi:hypothetical protein B566_EDAN004184 [Ephemera danica]|nr:hypothetical protein B566_EDAN004184 [Ephemera danica]